MKPKYLDDSQYVVLPPSVPLKKSYLSRDIYYMISGENGEKRAPHMQRKDYVDTRTVYIPPDTTSFDIYWCQYCCTYTTFTKTYHVSAHIWMEELLHYARYQPIEFQNKLDELTNIMEKHSPRVLSRRQNTTFCLNCTIIAVHKPHTNNLPIHRHLKTALELTHAHKYGIIPDYQMRHELDTLMSRIRKEN